MRKMVQEGWAEVHLITMKIVMDLDVMDQAHQTSTLKQSRDRPPFLP